MPWPAPRATTSCLPTPTTASAPAPSPRCSKRSKPFPRPTSLSATRSTTAAVPTTGATSFRKTNSMAAPRFSTAACCAAVCVAPASSARSSFRTASPFCPRCAMVKTPPSSYRPCITPTALSFSTKTYTKSSGARAVPRVSTPPGASTP